MSGATSAGDPEPLALRSQDDWASAYTAAVDRGEAQFYRARGVVGDTLRQLDDVGALARLVAALPPEMGLRIAPTQIVGAGAHPEDWITTVVPSIVALIGPAEPPVHDYGGRECYVPYPALQLTEWLLPDGDHTAGEPHAANPYHRLREACDKEGPAGILTAASSAIASIGTLLGDPEEGPLGFLPDDSEAREAIKAATDQIAAVAAGLTVLATQMQAEEDERNRSEE